MNKYIKVMAIGLALLAILVFSPLGQKIALAQDDGFVHPYNYPGGNPNLPTNSNNYYNGNQQAYYGYPIYTGPAPVVNSVTPSSVGVNQAVGSISIAINGSNFTPGTIARLNNADKSTIYVNSNYMVMQLPANDIALAGSYQVSVFNGTAGGLSNSVLFIVTSGGGAPATVKKSTGNSNSSASGSTPATTDTNTSPTTLAANALMGTSNGFWPSGLIQWIFVAILILLGVIIFRKIYTMDKEETPLKHA